MYQVRHFAWDFALRHHLREPLTFPDLERICVAEQWELFSYSQADELICKLGQQTTAAQNDAFTISRNNDVLIFYRDNLTLAQKAHAISHEFAHLVLKHTRTLEQGVLRYADKQEIEADQFAYELCLPSCVVSSCCYTAPSLISKHLCVTMDAARYYASVMGTESHTVQADQITRQYAEYIRSQRNDISEQAPTSKKKSQHHRYLICFAALIFVLGIAWYARVPHPVSQTAMASPTQVQAVETDKLSETVYITPNGGRYHRVTCRYAKQSSAEAVTLQEALALGRTPCKVCRPD